MDRLGNQTICLALGSKHVLRHYCTSEAELSQCQDLVAKGELEVQGKWDGCIDPKKQPNGCLWVVQKSLSLWVLFCGTNRQSDGARDVPKQKRTKICTLFVQSAARVFTASHTCVSTPLGWNATFLLDCWRGAIYDLESGQVKFLGQSPKQATALWETDFCEVASKPCMILDAFCKALTYSKESI